MSTIKRVFQWLRSFYWPASLNARLAMWFGTVCSLGIVWLSVIAPSVTLFDGIIVALATQWIVQIGTRRFLDRLWPDE